MPKTNSTPIPTAGPKALKMIRMLASGRQWFAVNREAEVPEMLIYDVIGTGMWGDDAVSPAAFRKALQEIEKDHDRMNLRINSPGGLVHDAFTIYNALKDSPLEIDVYIDGLAASCASWVGMSCHQVFIAPQAEMMIHDAWGFVMGTSKDMRKESDHLDSLTGMITQIYAKKTGLEANVLAGMMNETTWMTGAEAVEMGFADALAEGSKAAACAFDLDPDILPNLPNSFKAYQTALKKRAAEHALRDAGLSRAEAARCASESVTRPPGMAPADYTPQANQLIKQEIARCLRAP